jgi:hypothetical protein
MALWYSAAAFYGPVVFGIVGVAMVVAGAAAIAGNMSFSAGLSANPLQGASTNHSVSPITPTVIPHNCWSCQNQLSPSDYAVPEENHGPQDIHGPQNSNDQQENRDADATIEI